jgi:hypothetical protein
MWLVWLVRLARLALVLRATFSLSVKRFERRVNSQTIGTPYTRSPDPASGIFPAPFLGQPRLADRTHVYIGRLSAGRRPPQERHERRHDSHRDAKPHRAHTPDRTEDRCNRIR